MAIEIDDRLTIPDAELAWRFSPSGGPGGQHANRASTRVELTWAIERSAVLTESQRAHLVAELGTTATVSVDEERSQARNRDIAAQRLAERVRAALVVDKPRRPTRPSRRAKQRRVDAKRQRARDKQLRRPPKRDDY